MERYAGVRFETVFAARRPPVSDAAAAIVAWGRRFVAHALASGGEEASGNLSVRQEPGFLVTPTHVPLDALAEEDLVHVLEVEEAPPRVIVVGTHAPSSESLMHAAIYATRPEVRAVFHGHADEVVRHGAALGLATTPHEAPYGTVAMAHLAAAVAAGADAFVLASHGFVSLGRTADEAGRRALETVARVRAARGA